MAYTTQRLHREDMPLFSDGIRTRHRTPRSHTPDRRAGECPTGGRRNRPHRAGGRAARANIPCLVYLVKVTPTLSGMASGGPPGGGFFPASKGGLSGTRKTPTGQGRGLVVARPTTTKNLLSWCGCFPAEPQCEDKEDFRKNRLFPKRPRWWRLR